MDDICRLCLSFCPQKTTVCLENSDILSKTKSCFLLEIEINENFPNKICDTCTDLLKQFFEFHTKVSTNQKILEIHLNKGQDELEKFILSLKNYGDYENEYKEALFDDFKENGNICVHLTDISKKDIKIKHEVQNNPSHISSYSSEDDLSLSSIKEAKENKQKTVKTKGIWKKKILNSFSRKQAKKKLQTAKNEIKSSEKADTGYKNTINEHKCLTCLCILDTQTDLSKHYNTEHRQVQDLDLKISKNYETVDENGKKIYNCQKCDKVYESKSRITRHMISHLDSRPFICKLCGRTYKTVSEIIRHGRAHNGVKISCSFMCGYSTVYMGALREHEKRHTTEFKYKCEKCDKGFQVKTWFLEHQNIHNGVKPFVCDICGLAFHMNRYLTAHKSSVHPQCSSIKRYVCVHCSLPCDSRKALTEHYKQHGIKSSYLCDLCGKTLSNSEQLKFHRRMHLGVKPYSCGVCTKSFTKKFNLKLHERTHTSAKDYECVRCGKRYTQKSTLRRHLHRNHPEELNKERNEL